MCSFPGQRLLLCQSSAIFQCVRLISFHIPQPHFNQNRQFSGAIFSIYNSCAQNPRDEPVNNQSDIVIQFPLSEPSRFSSQIHIYTGCLSGVTTPTPCTTANTMNSTFVFLLLLISVAFSSPTPKRLPSVVVRSDCCYLVCDRSSGGNASAFFACDDNCTNTGPNSCTVSLRGGNAEKLLRFRR